MKNFNKSVFLSAVIIAAAFSFLNFTAPAFAAIPVLSLSAAGSGDNVQINVTGGDANVSVMLFAGSQSAVLGNTNSSGSFSITVSSATVVTNGIASNVAVYVKTNGLNGTMSNQVAWPYVTSSTTTSTLTLSQNAVLLNAGQTSTITASANSLYLLSNSTPAVANVNFNANQITIQALTYGSTTANICASGGTSNCSSITITVQNSSAQQLNFSQNNFSIISGQNISVTVSGGSGSYTITNNSNSNSIQASLNSSTVNLTATSTSGAASITVCTTDMNNCGIINVSSTAVNSSAITFSQTNPVVPIGQSTTVTIYGGVSGSNFYVSSNSNPSIVQANINGNILTLIGNASTGTSTISICAYGGSCGSLTANVNTVSNNGVLSLSQTSISILEGQSSNITILGGSTPYTISSANSSNIFNSDINGNVLTIYGINPGSATASVCSSAGCTNLSVTITSTTSTNTNQPSFSQNNILLNVGQQSTVFVSGVGGFYISNNSSPSVASSQITTNSVIVSAINAGSTNISVCQSGGQCSTLYVTVNSSNQGATLAISLPTQSVVLGSSVSFTATASGFTNPSYSLSDSFSPTTVLNSNINSLGFFNWTPLQADLGVHNITVRATDVYGHISTASSQITVTQTATTATTTPSYYIFPRYLGYGDKGDDVLQLQKFLFGKGFLKATPNGHFGSATKLAVKAFQKAHEIRQTGNVGPSTKDVLNQVSNILLSATSSSTTQDQQIAAIEQAIAQLTAQAKQMQGQ